MNKKVFLIVLVVITVIAVSGIIGAEYYTSQSQFCGSCHTTMKNPYELWAESGHKDVQCVDCHFAAGKESFLKAGYSGAEQLFALLSPDVEAIEFQVSSKVNNLGCTTSQCHIGERFVYGKINTAENVPFTHKPHDEGIIEGKILNCGTCHFDLKSDKNHVVTQKTCYLCEGLNHIFEAYF